MEIKAESRKIIIRSRIIIKIIKGKRIIKITTRADLRRMNIRSIQTA